MDAEPILHEPDLKAVPNKPALVTSKNHNKKKKGISLKWDEHAIEEHDQLRGTRMKVGWGMPCVSCIQQQISVVSDNISLVKKIDEPDTPYTYDHHSDSEASAGSHHSRDPKVKHLDWNHLENKLGAVAAVRATLPSSPSLSGGNSSGPDSDFELDGRRRRMKAKEFEMHRKAHYNEMEALKKWRAEHQNDSDDADEDEEM